MKAYRKITPLLDRSFGSGDAYLAELNSRVRAGNNYSAAVSDWLNLN